MKKLLMVFFAVAVAFSLCASTFAAGEEGQVTLIGKLDCVSCSLKKNAGAASQCSKYGCGSAIFVSKALDSKGQPCPDLKGKVVHILNNDKGNPLITVGSLHGKTVMATGKYYAKSQVFELVKEAKLYTCGCGGKKKEYVRSSDAKGCPGCGPKCGCEKGAAASAKALK